MSKIGNYVHYHIENYHKYGLSYNGKDGNDSNAFYEYQDKKTQILNSIQKYKDQKYLETFEKEINKLFGNLNDKNLSETESKNIDFIWKRVEERLSEDFNTSLTKINTSTGDIEKINNAEIQKSIEASIDTIKTKKTDSNIFLSTLIKRIRGIEYLLNNNIFGQTTQEELRTKLNEIYKEIADLSEYTINDLKLKGFSDAELKDLKINLKSAKPTIDQINQLIKDYVKVPDINLQRGTLFEFLLAYVPGIAKTDLQQTFKDFEKSVKGGERLDVLLDPSFFDDYIDFSALSNKEVKIGNKTYLSLGLSQQKIDVEIRKDDEFVEPLKISAKNVNLFSGKDVHIVSESPLLVLIQNEDPNFINHYLNVTAAHPKDDSKNDASQIAAAHETMKILLLYKGLSGDLIGREAANIFVYNNNKTEQSKVVDIYTLVKEAVKDIDNSFSVTANENDLSNIRYENDWIYAEDFLNGSHARINNLIFTLHQQKVNVALKPQFLLNKFDK